MLQAGNICSADLPQSLSAQYAATRALTCDLLAQLSEADACVQSMDDASPAKWHAGHTTWFWETFLLRDHLPGYRRFDETFAYLFNSYYEAEGERLLRSRRGLLSRPSLARILAWRSAVDDAMRGLLDDPQHADLIALGIAHEQQHIELLLTDIKHAFFSNPSGPAMWESETSSASTLRPLDWTPHPGGIATIGHQGDGFAFDNEGPAHRSLLEPFALADRLITNREWEAFMADGGYCNPALWLSDGRGWVKEHQIAAPLYWREDQQFTHCGWQQRDPDAPLTHISYFEADAFASWAAAQWQGARLPTEFEWEAAARAHNADPAAGNQLDSAAPPLPQGEQALFGDCWQFTRSAYLPFPRFRPAAGAVGEYNGKFMAGQWVLKGASCATVRASSRASYRNFFYPHQRWQFTGLRLAKDL